MEPSEAGAQQGVRKRAHTHKRTDTGVSTTYVDTLRSVCSFLSNPNLEGLFIGRPLCEVIHRIQKLSHYTTSSKILTIIPKGRLAAFMVSLLTITTNTTAGLIYSESYHLG